MFQRIADLIYSKLQPQLVQQRLDIERQFQLTQKLLGEIKMKQEDFDNKIDEMSAKVGRMGTELNDDSDKISRIVQGYKDEVAALQAAHGDTLDTSRLDELNALLDGEVKSIGGFADQFAPTAELPANPANEVPEPLQTVDAQPTPAVVTQPVAETAAAETVPAADQTVDVAPAADTETETA